MDIDPTNVSFLTQHPEDAVRVLEKLTPQDLTTFVANLSPEVSAKFFPFIVHGISATVLENLEPEKAGAILEKLDFDVVLMLLRTMQQKECYAILEILPEAQRHSLKESLQFKDNTVGSLMNTQVLTLPEGLTVLEAKRLAQKAKPKALLQYFYVLDKTLHLKSVIDVKTLFLSDRKTLVDTLTTPNPFALSAYDSLKKALKHPAWSEFDVLPVVGDQNKFLGVLNFRVVSRQFETTALHEIEDEGVIDTLVSLGEVFWSVGARFLANASDNSRSKEES